MTGNILIKLFPVMSQVQMMGKSCYSGYAFHALIGRVNLLISINLTKANSCSLSDNLQNKISKKGEIY